MDTTTLLIEAASTSGVAGSAMPDVLNRSAAYFGATEMNEQTVQAFLTDLKATAPHLFAPVQPVPGGASGALPPSWMSPSEKMTWARTHAPQAPVQRRPGRFEPSAAQLKSLEGKSTAEKMTLFRQWQAEAAP